MPADRGHDEHGFTLIEVLAALAIASIALAVLFGGAAAALRTAHATGAWEQAVSRAESRLAALDLVPGEREGDDGGSYRWQTRVALAASVPAPRTARRGPWSRGTGLYTVTITISWREGGNEQRFVLESARLGEIPAGGGAP